MKTFLAIFACAENSSAHEKWKSLSKEDQHALTERGMHSKDDWFEKYKNQIVYNGGMLGKTSIFIDNSGIRDSSQDGIFRYRSSG